MKDNVDIYANCSNGSLFTKSFDIICNDEVDVSICQSFINTGNYITKKNEIAIVGVSFDVQPNLTLNSSLYNTTNDPMLDLSSLTITKIDYSGMCKLYYSSYTPSNGIVSVNISLTSSASDFNNDIIWIRQPIFILKDYFSLIEYPCNDITLRCSINTSCSIIEATGDSYFNEIIKENPNLNKITSYSEAFDPKDSIENNDWWWNIFFLPALIWFLFSFILWLLWLLIFRCGMCGCVKVCREGCYLMEKKYIKTIKQQTKETIENGVNYCKSKQVLDIENHYNKQYEEVMRAKPSGMNYERVGEYKSSSTQSSPQEIEMTKSINPYF